MKEEDADDWYIVLGIPGLRQKGSKQFLSVIYDIIKEKNLDISLSDIKLRDDESVELHALRKVFGSAKSVFRTVIGNTFVNGIRFPESILYRVIGL